MGKLESTIKAEIQRLAKREMKSAFLPLRKEVRGLRLKLSSLGKNFKLLDRLAKEQIVPLANQMLKLEASPDEVKVARLTPGRIRNIRQKLGISQREMALLTGASMGAVVMWEKGKFRPKPDKKGALIALRKLGKRQVRKMLAEKGKNGKRPVAENGRKRNARPSKRGAKRKISRRRA